MLDQDFFQVSKLSQDQKKGLHQNGTLFSPNSGEDQKKGLHQKWNTFFMYWPALRCTPESNYRRDAVEVHTQIVEGYAVKVFGGIYPPPCFGTTAYNLSTDQDVQIEIAFFPTREVREQL